MVRRRAATESHQPVHADFTGTRIFFARDYNTPLGKLNAGTRFVADVDPGLHTFAMVAERHDAMQIVVKAGETYCVRFELDTGFVLYQSSLTPSEQRLFEQASAHLKPSKPLSADTAAAPAP